MNEQAGEKRGDEGSPSPVFLMYFCLQHLGKRGREAYNAFINTFLKSLL